MRASIRFANARERGHAFASKWAGARPEFVCILAHTDTCLLTGISSAGVTEDLRPLTPAADAEVVLLGRPVCLRDLPSNPTGAPGPAGITRAALHMADLGARFLGVGLTVWPQTPCVRVDQRGGGRVDLGNAVPHARDLFQLGLELGRDMGLDAPYIMLAESVPGGTTTALALLLALGYAADGRVSGSMPGNAHNLKSAAAHAGLRAAMLAPGDGRADPLAAVGQVGDPMQPLAAGIAIGAARRGCDVLLAGGSQMVAVAALVAALAGVSALERIAIGTTRWVIDDPAADVVGLTHDVWPNLPLLAANLCFARSRHQGLRLYEQFLVKEGVGAGGACIAALLATGESLGALLAEIERVYEQLLGRLSTSDSADSRRR